MNSKKYIEVREAFERLIANWIEDESDAYSESAQDIIKDKKFSNCKYHNNLENALYHPDDIPTHKLHKGWNYTDLRILEDFFSNKNFYSNNLDKMTDEKTKDILWEYISDKDIPEIEKRLKNND
tara:strand:+ start:704 stop:1075 length:372 start_codon:yes stop_codon:yes gene_type:complete